MLNLKAQRESLKLTLEDVGNYVGVGKSTVRKMIKPVVSLRLYYYNNKYRAEITIEYKGLKK